MADSDPDQHLNRTLSAPGFGTDMLSVLNDMRAEGVLLDVTVVAGEEEFMAHSTVLAYGSDYFRGLFTSGMKESQEKRVDLKDPGITAAGFKLVLDFLYSGQLVLSPGNVYDILAVANHLQVQSVLQLCSDFITQTQRDSGFNMPKYVTASKVADLYSLKAMQKSLDTVIAEGFMDVTSSDAFLESATSDEVIRLLQLDSLVAPSEQQVYEAASRWLMHDTSRMQHAASVLSHVRLALLDMGFLHGLLQTDVGAIQECRNLIMEAMAYHAFSPETRPSLDWPRSKSRTQNDGKPVLLALSSSVSRVQIFAMEGWETCSTFSTHVYNHGTIRAAAVVGNVLYAMCDVCFKSYNPASNTWSTLAFPQMNNRHTLKMVAHGNSLFVVCGKESNAWRFDISVGRWVMIPTLERYVSGVALLSCQEAVFAIGGNFLGIVDGNQKAEPTSVVQTFFPPNNCWNAVSPTIQPHADATAMVQGDIIYIAGGKTLNEGQISNSTTVEMCRAGLMVTMKASQWSMIAQPPSFHKFASQVAVIDRKAYFILGGQMHFTGKFVDDNKSVKEVEVMCKSFRTNLYPDSVVCATLALKI